jgi:hypothetical protein
MRNLDIAEDSVSRLVLRERAAPRILLGGISLAMLGGMVYLMTVERDAQQGFGFAVACGVIGLMGLLGASSIVRGYVECDHARRRLSILAGPRKLILWPRVVRYEDITKIVVSPFGQKTRRTYMVYARLRNSAIGATIDHTNDQQAATSIATKVAERIGCPVEGRGTEETRDKGQGIRDKA